MLSSYGLRWGHQASVLPPSPPVTRVWPPNSSWRPTLTSRPPVWDRLSEGPADFQLAQGDTSSTPFPSHTKSHSCLPPVCPPGTFQAPLHLRPRRLKSLLELLCGCRESLDSLLRAHTAGPTAGAVPLERSRRKTIWSTPGN